jgi:hypothetical protein
MSTATKNKTVEGGVQDTGLQPPGVPAVENSMEIYKIF